MNLLINGRLNSYLADINQQAEDMFFRLVEQMAEREGVTEQLKANNQMKWGARMNTIQSRATEIVNQDIITTNLERRIGKNPCRLFCIKFQIHIS